ncbi:MAG: MbtH family NRPS accessory protein [Leptolyngbyaceae cyanobacterium SM1_3_5]|nr:MbtH family NRPS accessory protein [Leptolyngbyaceae cyanobacterium SM1_3_5]
MNYDEQEDTTVYQVVINEEEQYSIWPNYREVPLGWRSIGKSGRKQECLDYIKEVWTDMRPLSLRRQMEQSATSSVCHGFRGSSTSTRSTFTLGFADRAVSK